MSTDQLIRITSWNVAGQDVGNGAMLDYLFEDSKRSVNFKPDIQIVGLQEAPQYLFSDPWTTNLSYTLKNRGYILFKRHKLSGILLYIFVLREMLLRVRDFETESVKTGFSGILGNKGGVSLRFTLNGNSISVTNSHLAAHQEKLVQRIDDYNSILTHTKFTIDPNTSSILTHDYSFWFGDLNFRLDDIEKHEVLNQITLARTSSSESDRKKVLSRMHKNDQLVRVRTKGQAFSEFNESLPEFLPTYKFHMGDQEAYNSENRIPAWTDRVLYRCHSKAYSLDKNIDFKPKLEQLFYDNVFETNLSDHKPVVSLFRVSTFDLAKYNPSRLPAEIIKFESIVGWRAGQDGRLWYKISNELFYMRPKILSSWDRIALYKSDFASLEDYLTIVFSNNIARLSPSLNAQEVPYPSSRTSSPNVSRRSSTSSSGSVTIGTEAITLNDTTPQRVNSPPQVPMMATIEARSLPPNDEIEGDGYKYFTALFPDDVLIPGKYVILYLNTNSANEYNVYGVSDSFDVLAQI